MRKPILPATFAEWFIECALSSGALTLEEYELENGQICPFRIHPEKFHSAELIDRVLFACNNAIRAYWPTPFSAFDILYGLPSSEGMMCASVVARKLSGMVLNKWGHMIRISDRVLLVSDIITDGKKEKEAIKFIKQRGGNPVGVSIVFDQHERVILKFSQKHKIPVIAAATLEDLMRVLKKKQDVENIKKISIYRKEHCIC